MTYQPGEIILDKYRIEASLGQGAFGEVYRVTHLELGVRRALKVLRRDAPGVGSSDFAEIQGRFQLEAQLGAQLNTPTPHPNLLQVHDFKRSGELLALEMEYAPGGSLIERLQKSRESGQPIPITEAVAIALDVASGLAALHARDIVHRDLKPGNILFDQQGRAKVADLGLAQVPGGPSMRSQLSQPLPHPGTPAYKSPEQESSGNYLTAASDVYALGAVLFEMLTGRVYRNVRPGTRASSLRQDTPGWLEDLLRRMLAENYRERPWDGLEMQTLLQGGEGTAQTKAQAQAEENARLEEKKRLQQAAAQIKSMQDAEDRRRREADEKGRLEEENRRQRGIAERERWEAEEKARLEMQKRNLSGLTLELAPGVSMEFMRVPAGEFWMGSNQVKGVYVSEDEHPQHKIYVDEYLMSKTLVTNSQYQAFVEASRYRKPQNWTYGKIPNGKEQHPVVNVNWQDAVAFCEWASRKCGTKVRLPTEAEWEKAARGMDGQVYPWGDQAPDANRCNFLNKEKDTTPVGRYSPKGDSPYGAQDMAVNVREWVNDLYDKTYYNQSPQRNPRGPSNGISHVVRGGTWGSNAIDVRSADRDCSDPHTTSNVIGFRCAQ